MSARPSHLGDAQRSTVITLTVVAGLILFVYSIQNILIPFIFAGIIAYVVTPLINALARRARLPRWLFAVAILLVLLGLTTLVGLLGIPPLMRELTRVLGDLQGTLTKLLQQLIGNGKVTMLGQGVAVGDVSNKIVSGVQNWFASSAHIGMLAGYGFASVFGFIFAWVILGYLLIGGRRVADGLFWLVPPRLRPFVHRVWADLDPILRRYFLGVAMIVVYAAIAAYIGLGLILGIHHAIFLALITGVFEVIPMVGPAASAVIAGLVAVQEASSAWAILAYVAYATALRISIDEFFGPMVLGRAAYVSPVLVMFCFLSGAVLFGAIGVVLAIPVALSVKATLAELYKEPEAIRE